MPVPSDLSLSQLVFLRAAGGGAWGIKASTAQADPRTIRSLESRGLIELRQPAPGWGYGTSHPEAHWQATLKALRSPVWSNQPHRLA